MGHGSFDRPTIYFINGRISPILPCIGIDWEDYKKCQITRFILKIRENRLWNWMYFPHWLLKMYKHALKMCTCAWKDVTQTKRLQNIVLAPSDWQITWCAREANDQTIKLGHYLAAEIICMGAAIIQRLWSLNSVQLGFILHLQPLI